MLNSFSIRSTMLLATLATFTLASASSLSEETAQQFGPWVWGLSGGALNQFDAGFDDGEGEFNVTRGVIQGSFGYAWDRQTSIALSVGAGVSDYNFSSQATIEGEQPWEKIEDYRVSLPMRFSPSEKSSVIVIPSLRTYAESGADLDDGRTEGILAAFSWRFSDTLTLGPGFGWFSEVGGGNTAFPIIAVDWKITEKLSLETGRGLAASQGPGITLNYELDSKWKVGITGRYEKTRFALDDNAEVLGEDRIGEDRSMPLLLTLSYSPWPMTNVSLIAGAEFDGRLELEDSDGNTFARSEYDTAPVIGLTFSSRF
jgi:hypothetical protein